jgi:hypothetical protein
MMSREKLAEIGEIHADLQRLIGAIEAETSKPAPDMASLSAVRLRLTQASRRRAALANAMIDELAANGSADTRAQLDALRQDLRRARFTSAEHIGHWTMRSITKDWAGYRAASGHIRTAMRKQIDREAALFRSLAG